jgi:ribosome-associated translation inhibitor RaiA
MKRFSTRRRLMGKPGGGPPRQARYKVSRHAPGGGPVGPVRPPAEVPVTVVAAAPEVGPDLRLRARRLVAKTASHAPRPVLHARVVLGVQRDAALERPAVVKVTLDVGGRPVRAHVAAAGIPEALDLVAERLRRNLERLEELERSRRHGADPVEPGEWRHGAPPAGRPGFRPRAPEDRHIVRRKSFAPSPATPEQAVLEMEILDHDFHLFVNADTGEENVVYRRPEGGLALAAITPENRPRPFPVPVDPAPAPAMLVEDAVELLDASGAAFAFFVDPQTRRGRLLYRRYDGNYGLVEPAG